MNSFEWKQLSMLRNPLSSTTQKKKNIADQLKEQAMAAAEALGQFIQGKVRSVHSGAPPQSVVHGDPHAT